MSYSEWFSCSLDTISMIKDYHNEVLYRSCVSAIGRTDLVKLRYRQRVCERKREGERERKR